MSHVKVLLVEPDLSARNIFAESVKRTRYEICGQVNDLYAGIALYKELQPRIVVLALTGQSGLDAEAARIYKKAAPEVRLVITYDGEMAHAVPMAVKHGVCGCLKKPFNHDRALMILERADQAGGGLSAASRGGPHAPVKWPAHLREAGTDGVWHGAVVSDVTAAALTVYSHHEARAGHEYQIEIMPPNTEKRIQGTVRIKDVGQLLSGGYRAFATILKLEEAPLSQAPGEAPRPGPVAAPQPGPVVRRPAAQAATQEVQASFRQLKGRADTYVLYLAGSLDALGTEPMEKAMSEVPPGKMNLLLDLGNVQRINSAGVGILIAVLTRAARFGARVALCTLRNEVLTVLQMVGVAELFNIFSDQTEAIAWLDQQPREAKDAKEAKDQEVATPG